MTTITEACENIRRIYGEDMTLQDEAEEREGRELLEPSGICSKINICVISQYPEISKKASKKFCIEYYNLCNQRVRDSYMEELK